MGKPEIRREALQRQGRCIDSRGRFYIPGDQNAAKFEQGSEGIVQLAVNKKTNIKYRIKSFWEPTDARRQRSQILTKQRLADRSKDTADPLGGAPFELINDVANSPNTPFAIVMKNVHGVSWKNLHESSKTAGQYPARGWPAIAVRATWAYGLATAVKNMEARNFFHADLSPGNVMVTPTGPTAGDMALVDFDSFVHPLFPTSDSTLKGTEGYAAPEIWSGGAIGPGSDRLGMAILIQEFLFCGDPDITRDEVFTWSYDQTKEIERRAGDPHPLVAKKYPKLAELVAATLRAREPNKRPSPDQWRPLLKALVEPSPKLTAVRLAPIAVKDSRTIAIADSETAFDLLQTPFAIRATLQRGADAALDVVAHHGAVLNIRLPGSPQWLLIKGGERVRAKPGMVLFDKRGKLSARLEADER